MNSLLIFFGKMLSLSSRFLNRGSGSTWPGHIALKVNSQFLLDIQKQNPQLQIIFVSGTNGKTTTSKMIAEILRADSKKVFLNESGANLLNGLASGFIRAADVSGRILYDYFVFEIDENWLPVALQYVTPKVILLLNLFRDQLDRYGELRMIAANWQKVFAEKSQQKSLPILIFNADDPLVSYIGYVLRDTEYDIRYFGLPTSNMQNTEVLHGADSMYCPYCGEKLNYKKLSYSHLGDWNCPQCKLKRPDVSRTTLPKLQLSGIYNLYNALAAKTVTETFGVSSTIIDTTLSKIQPAFGRQEKITIGSKYAQIILSKNPTGSNQSMEAMNEMRKSKKSVVLFVLNDRIPDGRDVSWIWDVDYERYISGFSKIIVSGDRTYDMALRMHYAGAGNKLTAIENLSDAIQFGLSEIAENETLYMLPTYSAMLDVRKVITGKAIL